MNWLLFIIISLFCSVTNTGAQQIIEKRTDQIFRRWYLVERLDKPMELVKQLYKRYANKLLPLNGLPSGIITDPLVNNCIDSLSIEKNFEPVLRLWHQVQSFKYPQQGTLPVDFAVLICILLKHYCVTFQKANTEDDVCQQIQIPYEQLMKWDTVKVLDLITRVTHFLKGKTYACLLESRTVSNSRVFFAIGAKDISLRFCLVSRLQKTFDWLAIFKNKKISFFKTMLTRDPNTIVVDEYVTLNHPRIVLCCKEMAETESLAPFVALWKQFKRFEEIRDVDFLKDFLKLVFVTYHYLFLGNLLQKNKIIDNLVQEMFRWSSELNEYSLMQILEVIDVIEHSCDGCITNIKHYKTMPGGLE